MSRRTAAMLVACASAAIAIGLLVLRRTPEPGGPTARGMELAGRAVSQFATCPSAPIDEPDAVLAGLLGGTIRADASVDPVGFFEQLISLMGARASGDVNDYVAWAQRQGYALAADEWPEENRAKVAPVLGLSGVPASEISVDDLFRRFYKRRKDHFGDIDLPTRIALGPDCVHGVFRVQTETATVPSFPFHDMPGAEVWIGEVSYGQHVFWKHPVRAEDVLVRDGELQTGHVYLSIQGPTGIWFPVSAQGYFDPVNGEWRITRFSYLNTYEVNSGPLL